MQETTVTTYDVWTMKNYTISDVLYALGYGEDGYTMRIGKNEKVLSISYYRNNQESDSFWLRTPIEEGDNQLGRLTWG